MRKASFCAQATYDIASAGRAGHSCDRLLISTRIRSAAREKDQIRSSVLNAIAREGRNGRAHGLRPAIRRPDSNAHVHDLHFFLNGAADAAPARIFVTDVAGGQITRKLAGTCTKCVVLKLHVLPVSKSLDPRSPGFFGLSSLSSLNLPAPHHHRMLGGCRSCLTAAAQAEAGMRPANHGTGESSSLMGLNTDVILQRDLCARADDLSQPSSQQYDNTADAIS